MLHIGNNKKWQNLEFLTIFLAKSALFVTQKNDIFGSKMLCSLLMCDDDVVISASKLQFFVKIKP